MPHQNHYHCARLLRSSLLPSRPLHIRNLTTAPPLLHPSPPAPTNPSTSTSAAQPFSTPFTPTPSRDPAFLSATSSGSTKPKKPEDLAPKSSVKAGTVLKGLGYIKGQESPVAREDSEYPEWLWGLLDQRRGEGSEGVEDEGDAFAKSKKQRRKAARAERRRELLDPESLKPKIPVEHQSIDLPSATPEADQTGESEAQRVAREARQGLTGAMRKGRRKSIKEGNFLKGIR